jgi:hypothetical protein
LRADAALRRAGPGDNDAILGFMREQSMQAGLALRFERRPDYFALLAAHNPVHRTWVATVDTRIVAIASVVVRPAWVDRSIRTVAYLADLRQAAGRGSAGLWRRLAGTVLEEIRAEFGAQQLFFSILRDNRLARASILHSPLGKALHFRHLRGYCTVTLVGRIPWLHGARSGVRVRHASAADSESLRQFIDTCSRDQQLAPVFDPATWQHRLRNWPDFDIGRFLVAINAEDRITGCLAPWDSSSINRIVIESLPPGAELLRRAVNAVSRITRRPRIGIGATSHLPVAWLTHPCIPDRDPAVLAALLQVAWREMLHTRRHAALSLCLYDGDPLWRALRGMVRSAVPMDLYCVSLDPAAQGPQDTSLWPGFEGYLV